MPIPDLTLSMDDKIYLAVAKETKNKTAFVYTLACMQFRDSLTGAIKRMNYDCIATREIHAFQDKRRAQIYYDTVKQIVNINKLDANKNVFFVTNQDVINRFYEHTK